MKTALQQAISDLNRDASELQMLDNKVVKAILLKLSEYLDIEKEQITAAYVEGGIQGIPAVNKPSSYAEQYYLTTFKQQL